MTPRIRTDGKYSEFWFLPISLQLLFRVKTLSRGRAVPRGGCAPMRGSASGSSSATALPVPPVAVPLRRRGVEGIRDSFFAGMLLGRRRERRPSSSRLRRSQFSASTEEGDYGIGSSEELETDVGATHLLIGGVVSLGRSGSVIERGNETPRPHGRGVYLSSVGCGDHSPRFFRRSPKVPKVGLSEPL